MKNKASSPKNSRPRAGIALYQAAMANPTDYTGFLRLVHLRKMISEDPEFREQLDAIWQPVRRVNNAIKAASLPIRPLMERVFLEFNAQMALIQADITRLGKAEKAEFDKLIAEVKQATIKADQEWTHLFDCPRPKTVEDWQRLAARAGLPSEFVLKGQWIPEDILPIIEGYLLRLKDQKPVVKYEDPAKHSRKSGRTEAPKRAWTLPELEIAIQEYKAQHSAQLQKILSVLDDSRSTAIEKTAVRRQAQKIFGRNAIAAALGVRGGKLVGQTTAWKALSKLLGLRCKKNDIVRNARRQEIIKTGNMAPLSSENEPSTAYADDEIREEEREKTLRCIRQYSESNKKNAQNNAKPIYEKYLKGQMSDEQVRETIAMLYSGKF